MSTIREVARVAHVSPTTVSFVLRNRKGVKRETRQRVEAAIERVGYTPRRVGRPAASPAARSKNIAVVSGAKPPPFVRDMTPTQGARNGEADARVLANRWLASLHEAVDSVGDHFNLFAGFDHVLQNELFQSVIENGQVDGVVLAWESPEDGYLNWLLERDVPLVVLNRRPNSGRRFSYVEIDNYAAGAQVAECLLDHGHTRCALLQPDDVMSYNLDRAEGFVDALNRRGLEPVAHYRTVPEAQRERVCREVLEAGPTAVFTTTGSLAILCLNTFETQGVAVPEQLSLVGFDNLTGVSEGGLRPSSVGYDERQLGHLAVKLLRQLIEQPELNRLSASIATQVIEHDTTAAAPAGRP